MKLIIHQALKDVRLLRWPLLAWVAVLVVFHGITLYVLSLTQPDDSLLRRLETIQTILTFPAAGAFIVIAVVIVHNDSPVTTTDFWLTRPISGGTMLGSKLLTGVVALWALPLLGDVIDLTVAGNSIGTLGPSRLAFQLAWLLPLMAIAACTNGLSQFVLVAIIEFLLAAVLGNAAYSLAYPWAWPRRSAGWLDLVFVPTLVMCTLLALSLALFAYPYLTRRKTRAAVLLGLAPLIFATVVGVGVYAVARPEARSVTLDVDSGVVATRARAETTADSLRGISVSVDPAAVTLGTRGEATTFDVPVTIDGAPADTRIWVSSAGGWLQAGPTRVALGQLQMTEPRSAGENEVTEATAVLHRALDGVRLLPTGWIDAFTSRRHTTVFVRSRDLPSAGTVPAILHLKVNLYLAQYRPAGSMPVRAGASLTAGSKSSTVLDVRNSARATISLRESEAYRSYTWFEYYLLRNASRKEAVVPVLERGAWFDAGSNGLSFFMPVSGRLRVYWRNLDVDWRRAQVPLPAEWLRDAELISLERQTVGQGSKTVEVPVRLSK